MKALLGTNKPIQIGMVVNDVEQAKKEYARFWGVDVPPTCELGDYEIIQTTYKGEAAPDISCKMAFFELENIQYEIIEPNSAKSIWRDFIDERGEGLHHIAYQVEDLDETIKACKDMGWELVQQGIYPEGTGTYLYFDATKDLGSIIELLHNFK